MNRFVIYFLLSLFFLFLLPSPSHAVDPTPTPRHAECDACGYCNGRDVPESWIDCRNCLYPNVAAHNGQATSNETLEVITDPADPRLDPAKKALNQPVPPARGKYFTQLGCVDTSLSSFSDPGAAGGVLNFILTKLIFPATGVLAFGALIYGSFMLITAQGAEMQIARGKRYVTGSIVGLIFTFSVVLIVNIIGGDVLRIPGLSRGTIIEMTVVTSCEGTNGNCPSINLYTTTSTSLPSTYPIPVNDPWHQTIISQTTIPQINTGIEGVGHNEFKLSLTLVPPNTDKPFRKTITASFEDYSDNLFVEFDNDQWGNGDKNIIIESITFGEKTCTNFEAILHNNSNGSIYIIPNRPLPADLFVDGIIRCTQWN